jgi:glycosyltransferase involved in cell wall biosynthesis
MTAVKPRISICIPHWQAQLYMTLCLRSIRKHSANYDLEVIVVDNGSRDESLDYLRSLPWIRLIERPEEKPTNWPLNVFTAWDRGLEVATGDYYLTMHSDVFVKSDAWLGPFLREISTGTEVAATGSWKLELEHPFYAWQKRTVGYAVAKAKALLGLGKRVKWQQANYPRDYCALYRPEALRENKLTFCPVGECTGGGYSIARQLWDVGYSTPVFPVYEMARCVYHIAHGTAAIAPEKRLNHAHKQKQTEIKLARLLAADWIRALQIDWTLDEVDEEQRFSGQAAARGVDKVVEVADQFANLQTSRQNQPLAHL